MESKSAGDNTNVRTDSGSKVKNEEEKQGVDIVNADKQSANEGTTTGPEEIS